MTQHQPNQSPQSTAPADSTIVFSEKQWVPWYFWLNGALVIAVTTATFGLNRQFIWAALACAVLSLIGVWVLWSWSSTVLTVERDPDGTKWLTVKGAQLPNDVVSRMVAVPASARRNALGPQLDPAAFLVTHAWIQTHVMLVLDDPQDPTPYWMVATKKPEQLIAAFQA